MGLPFTLPLPSGSPLGALARWLCPRSNRSLRMARSLFRITTVGTAFRLFAATQRGLLTVGIITTGHGMLRW